VDKRKKNPRGGMEASWRSKQARIQKFVLKTKLIKNNKSLAKFHKGKLADGEGLEGSLDNLIGDIQPKVGH